MIPRRDRVAREREQATRTGVDNKVRVVRDIGGARFHCARERNNGIPTTKLEPDENLNESIANDMKNSRAITQQISPPLDPRIYAFQLSIGRPIPNSRPSSIISVCIMDADSKLRPISTNLFDFARILIDSNGIG